MSYIQDKLYENSKGPYKSLAKHLSGLNKTAYSNYQKEQAIQSKLVSNYNDPKQLNSVADILFNPVAVNNMDTNYATRIPIVDDIIRGVINLGNALDTHGSFDMGDIIQTIAAPLQLARTTWVDPILYEWQNNTGLDRLGGFQKSGINLLMNLGETLDIAANPIKGMILEKEGPIKGLTRGLGFTDEGKYNYDYDTGNKLVNMALELVSDPLTWLSFGAGKIMSSGLPPTNVQQFVLNADRIAQQTQGILARAAAHTSSPLPLVQNLVKAGSKLVKASNKWKFTAPSVENPFQYVGTKSTIPQADISEFIKGGDTGELANYMRVNSFMSSVPTMLEKVKDLPPSQAYISISNTVKNNLGMDMTQFLDTLRMDAMRNPELFTGPLFSMTRFINRIGIIQEVPGFTPSEQTLNFENTFAAAPDLYNTAMGKQLSQTPENKGFSLFKYASTGDTIYRVHERNKLANMIEFAPHYRTFRQKIANVVPIFEYAFKDNAHNRALEATLRTIKEMDLSNELVETLYMTEELSKMAPAVIDMLITYGNSNIWYTTPEDLTRKIITGLNTKTIGFNKYDSTKLDLFDSKSFESWADANGVSNILKSGSHNAIFDGYRIRHALHENPDLLKDIDPERVKTAITMDIETTGLATNSGIVSIGYTIPTIKEDGTVQYTDKLYNIQQEEGIVPSTEVLRLLFGSLEEGTDLSPEELYQKYVETYVHADDLYSMETVAEQMHLDFKDLDNPLLLTYNGDNFDLPRIINAIRRSNEPMKELYIETLRRLQHVDVLKRRHAAMGLDTVPELFEARLLSLIDTHLNKLKAGNANKVFAWLPTLNKKFANPIRSILSGHLKRRMVGVSHEEWKAIRDMYKYANETYKEAYLELYEATHKEKPSDEFTKQFIITKRASDGAFLDRAGNVISNDGSNIMQLFNRTQLGDTIAVQGMMSPYGVAAVYKPELVKKFFKMEAQEQQIFLAAKQELAKAATYRMDNVRNIPMLAKLHPYLPKWFTRMIIGIPFENYRSDALNSEDFDIVKKRAAALIAVIEDVDIENAGSFERYGIMLTVYKTLRKNKIEVDFGASSKEEYALAKSFFFDDVVAKSPYIKVEDTFFELAGEDIAPTTEMLRAIAHTAHTMKRQINTIDAISDNSSFSIANTNASSNIFMEALDVYRLLYARVELMATTQGGSSKKAKAEAYEMIKGLFKKFSNDVSSAQIEAFLTIPDEDVALRLMYSGGMVTFIEDIRGSKQNRVYLREATRRAVERFSDNKINGVGVYVEPVTKRVYVYLIADSPVVKNLMQKLEADELDFSKFNKNVSPMQTSFKETNPMLAEAWEGLTAIISKYANGAADGTMFDLLDYAAYSEFFETLPMFLRKIIISPDKLTELRFFENHKYNRTIIGNIRTRRIYDANISENIFKNMVYTIKYGIIPTMDTKEKYIQMFFSEPYSVKGGLFSDYDPKEIYETLKDTVGYHLVTLKKDPKLGPFLESYDTDKMSFAEFKEVYDADNLHPIIVSTGTLTNAARVINAKEYPDPVLMFMKRWIIVPLKITQLSTFGFLGRNIIDSFLKTLSTLDSPYGLGQLLRQFLIAMRLDRDYTAMVKMVYELNDGMFSKSKLSEMYEWIYTKQFPDTVPKELRDEMMTLEFQRIARDLPEQDLIAVHTIFKQGAAIGIDRVVGQGMYTAMQEEATSYTGTLAEFVGNLPFVEFFFDKTAKIERIMRLATFLNRRAQGDSVAAAQFAVYHAHFDTAVKSTLRMKLEYFMPFIGFSTDNVKLWNSILSKKGWMLTVLRDILSPLIDFQNNDEELQYNQSLQYNILAGNIVMDNNLVFKMSASVLDALRFVTDPREVMSRMFFYVNTPLELIIDGTEGVDWFKMLVTNMPIIGPYAYRYWGMQKYFQDVLNIAESMVTGKVPKLAGNYQSADGPAVKGMYRIDGNTLWDKFSQLLIAAIPSLFSGMYSYRELTHNTAAFNKLKKGYKNVPKYYRDDLYGPGSESESKGVSARTALKYMRSANKLAEEETSRKSKRYVPLMSKYTRRTRRSYPSRRRGRRPYVRKSFVQRIRPGAYARRNYLTRLRSTHRRYYVPNLYARNYQPNINYAKGYGVSTFYGDSGFALPRVYHTRTYNRFNPLFKYTAKGFKAPKSYADKRYTMFGYMYSGQTPKPKNVGRAVIYSTPRNFFYKLYTRRGTATWAPRTKPTTPTTLRAVLRRDWAYLR